MRTGLVVYVYLCVQTHAEIVNIAVVGLRQRNIFYVGNTFHAAVV